MNLTCSQISSLLPFYLDNTLNLSLMNFVTQHLKICPACNQKYQTLKKIFADFSDAKTYIDNYKVDLSVIEDISLKDDIDTKELKLVQNLSAYIDNELSDEESLKIKKYVVKNLSARKTLEDIYKVKSMLHNSFEKTKVLIKEDFSKKVLRQLNIKEEINKKDPMLKVLSMFTLILILFVTCVIFAFLI